jgi:hypothetical protein
MLSLIADAGLTAARQQHAITLVFVVSLLRGRPHMMMNWVSKCCVQILAMLERKGTATMCAHCHWERARCAAGSRC